MMEKYDDMQSQLRVFRAAGKRLTGVKEKEFNEQRMDNLQKSMTALMNTYREMKTKIAKMQQDAENGESEQVLADLQDELKYRQKVEAEAKRDLEAETKAGATLKEEDAKAVSAALIAKLKQKLADAGKGVSAAKISVDAENAKRKAAADEQKAQAAINNAYQASQKALETIKANEDQLATLEDKRKNLAEVAGQDKGKLAQVKNIAASITRIKARNVQLRKNADSQKKRFKDLQAAQQKKAENMKFMLEVQAGFKEYKLKEEEAKKAATTITELTAKGKTLTKKDDIKANKKALARARADKDVATSRMKDLKAEYDSKLAQKKAREEEEKLQAEMDAQYKKQEAMRLAAQADAEKLQKMQEDLENNADPKAKAALQAKLAALAAVKAKKDAELKKQEMARL